ncbi:MAG: hypothetical protein V3V78_01840, partial [Candidatus Woesearchaeota archaeon]
IDNLDPESGSFFYEGTTLTDISGTTDPSSELELFVDKEPDSRPHYMTEADENGNFEFDDVELEGVSLAGIIGLHGELALQYDPSDSDEIYEPILPETETEKPEKRDIRLNFLIKNLAGQIRREQVSYTVGTCFSGGMNWGVQNLNQYQTPNILSPERLEQGTEIISSVFNLSYRGFGTNPKIKGVSFERACEASSMAQDERYNVSCQIIPTGQPQIKEPNEDQTLWYVRYNLNSYDEIDEYLEFPIEAGEIEDEIIFPLRVRVTYTHEIDGEEEEVIQTSCMNLAYIIDTSRIEPEDLLPDWMLDEDNLKKFNESLQDMNELIERMDTVVRYAAIGCFSGFALRLIAIISKRWSSWSEYLADRITMPENDDDDGTKCPAPGTGKAKNPLAEGDSLEKDTTQDDLTNTDLQERCPSTFNSWEFEQSMNTAYRWACDRFLCKGTPAKWTSSSDPEEVRTKIERSMACTQQEGTKGIILRRPSPDECSEHTKKSVCWIHDDAYYIYDKRAEGDEVWIKPVDESGAPIPAGAKPLKGTQQGDSIHIEEIDTKKCAELCKDKGYLKEESKCVVPEEAAEMVTDRKQPDNEIITTAKECLDKDEYCLCQGRGDKKTFNPPQDTMEGVASGQDIDEDLDLWDYRYNKLGYYYNKYKYYSGRDRSACFGANNLISPGDAYLSPSDTVPAFQCVCTTQIRNRLVLLRNVLEGIYNCLNQIRVTGETTAGICKELFTQYICDWTYRLITTFMKGCTPWKGTGKDSSIGDALQAGTQAIYGGISEATNDLMGDYDSAAMRDFLGVGEGAIARKICLGSLTGDWGWDLEGFMDAAYSTPFATSARAFPADREYLTWNPDNSLSTYEYRTAWMLAPGCEIESYTVSLACITDHELFNYDGASCEQLSNNPNAALAGCDCITASGSKIDQGKAGPSKIIHTSRSISQGVFEDGNVHVIDEHLYRYDNVKITLYLANEADSEKCIPEENRLGARAGVFYSPISDATTQDILACRWDVISGEFRCDQGGLLWEQRGRAYFSNIRCEEGGDEIDCEDKTFYLGDELEIESIPVFVQSQDQCLYYQLKNGHGHVIKEGVDLPSVKPDEVDPNSVWKENERRLHFGTIQEEDFTSTNAQLDPHPSGSGVINVRTTRNVNYGATYYMWFKNVQNDGRGEYSLNRGSSWGSFDPDTIIDVGGVLVKFNRPQVPSNSMCGGTSNCREYTLKILQPSYTISDAIWNLRLELRYMPESGDCTQSLEQDLISYQGEAQKKDLKLKVAAKTQLQSGLCAWGGQNIIEHKNTQPCDCDSDGNLNEAEDCDGTSKFYCYGEGTGKSNGKCYATPRCFTGDTENKNVCDCDWDGNVNDDTECYRVDNNNGGYCVNNACTRTIPTSTTPAATPPATTQPSTLPDGTIIAVKNTISYFTSQIIDNYPAGATLKADPVGHIYIKQGNVWFANQGTTAPLSTQNLLDEIRADVEATSPFEITQNKIYKWKLAWFEKAAIGTQVKAAGKVYTKKEANFWSDPEAGDIASLGHSVVIRRIKVTFST